MDKYYSAAREAEREIVIERSRFIGFAREAATESEARAFIEEIRKKHSLATHNCYAFVTDGGMVKRSSDDGEPSGTAGTPILDAITFSGLIDTAVVVTRYFGGVKLGAGGLTRAYSKTASEALIAAGRAEHVLCAVFRVSVPYDKLAKITKTVSGENRKILSTDYRELVTVEFAAPVSEEEKVSSELRAALSGEAAEEIVDRKFLRLTDL